MSQVLTIGDLLDRLVGVDRSLPVVIQAVDEPVGNYGVRDIEVVPMQRESTYAADPNGWDVYHSDFRQPSEYYDEPGPVAFLTIEAPPSPQSAD
ncbi:hypothetical protein [Mycolicibacterium nivoides]|uniref:Uncharacterized protein n=1 Tax=Mycolicibacterium nivoides TaxID=2487344 RepID=A0ABW9LKN8_9MYCO